MEFTEINTRTETGYSAKMKRDGITTEIKFLLDIQTDDIEYYWVELWSYRKRKDADRNMNHLTTFGGGVHRLYFAREAIKDFIEQSKQTGYSFGIVVHWADNRRRDVYVKALTKLGFAIERYNGELMLVYRYIA